MPRRTAYLESRHLKFYGSVLGARPETLEFDEDLIDETLARSKAKKIWGKKVRRPTQEPDRTSSADDDQRAG